MIIKPYEASLRVFEPVEEFNIEQLETWKSHSESFEAERYQDILRLIYPRQASYYLDSAHFLEIEGNIFVSPWSVLRRCWDAEKALEEEFPQTLIKIFFPDKIRPNLDIAESLDVKKPPHVLLARWSIPPRWFALFQPQDRRWGELASGPFSILQTKLEKAIERCEITLRVIQEAFGSGQLALELIDLLTWLKSFNSQSILRCDYGGLALILEKSLKESGKSGLADDSSIEDVQNAIEGLKMANGKLASEGYERLVSTWRKVSFVEQLN